MSTIKVNKIENTSTTAGGIEVDTSGHVKIDGQQLPTAGPLSNRNLIINGAMQFAQRGISANNITSTSAYRTVDRYKQFINTLGTWTVERHASGPPGFDYSYRATCTSGNASPASGSHVFIRYGVEKQDMQRLAWATTEAKEFTLSFWVKSNRTGTASLTILYSDGNLRGVTKTYTIDAANTWEHKSLTFPANGLSESSEGDNGVGFWIEWWLNSGSTFTGGSANTDWATLNDNQRNPTNFGLGSVDDQEFHLTGVQLEVGSKSTSFEHRSYSDELQRCMRYYETIEVYRPYGCGLAWSNTAAQCGIRFTEKRGDPNSVTLPAASPGSGAGGTSFLDKNANYPSTFGSFGIDGFTENMFRVVQTGVVGFTAGTPALLWKDSTDTGYIRIDAEL